MHLSKLRIQLGQGWNATTKTFTTPLYDQTIRMTELQGKKVSLSFSGNSAFVRLDETQLGSAVTITAANVQMRLLATHNHYELAEQANDTFQVIASGGTDQDEVKTYLKGNNFAYAIIYSFGNADKHLRYRQEKLEAYRRAGVADTDWRVMTETLNVMGLSWMHQTYLQDSVISSYQKVIPLAHHRFGRVSQESSYYIDVGLQFSGSQSRGGNTSFVLETLALSGFFASAMEHSVIEQLQGDGVAATSTIRLLHLANQAGQKIYRATSGNWSAITPQLLNYTPGTLSSIQASLAPSGVKALIPQNAQITLNQWRGIGYAMQAPISIGMLIEGNLFGGYGSVPAVVNPAPVAKAITASPSYNAGKNTAGGKVPIISYSTPQFRSTDPVDMLSGAFVLDSKDLSIGSGAAPHGVSFSRHYNSNRRYDKSTGLGYGWTHNSIMTAARSTSTKAALGETIPYHAVPFYVAMTVASDLYTNHTNAKEWATCALISNWLTDQLKNNAVAITMGNQTIEFIKMPNGTYEAPPNSNYTLTGVAGNPDSFSLKERHGSTYNFTNGRITSITDLWNRNGTFSYLTSFPLRNQNIFDVYNRSITFNWTGDKITSITDPAGNRTVTFGYTGDDLTSVTDVESKTWRYEYDIQHRLKKTIDPSNRTIIENFYDSEDRVTEQWSYGDPNKKYKLTYSGYCNVEENPQGGRMCYLYDERSRGIGTIDAVGNQPSIAFDGHDRQIVSRTPELERTENYFDTNNNLTRSNDPIGEDSFFTYDSQLRLKTTTDKRDKITTINTYNAQHQPTQVTAPLGRVTNTTYTLTGEVDTVTDAEGNVTDNDYNTLGQLILTKVNGQAVSEFTYNSYGDVETIKDGLGQVTTNTYNKRRQLLTSTRQSIAGQPASIVTNFYDNEGRLLKTVDPRGNETSFTYTATGKAETTTVPAIPTPSGLLNNVATNFYDSRDWLNSSNNSLGHTTTPIYDAAQ
ncbi:MAG: RHS repeat protein, partial [Akkermansiaceae bacterium]|nr:RHS repeat protein [Akkermansiaceae bacterium]